MTLNVAEMNKSMTISLGQISTKGITTYLSFPISGICCQITAQKDGTNS